MSVLVELGSTFAPLQRRGAMASAELDLWVSKVRSCRFIALDDISDA
jgi:hypothetical protein